MKQHNLVAQNSPSKQSSWSDIYKKISRKYEEISKQYGIEKSKPASDFENIKNLDQLLYMIFNQKIELNSNGLFQEISGKILAPSLAYSLKKLIKFDLIATDENGFLKITESMANIAVEHGIKINSSFSVFKKTTKILKNKDFLAKIATESIKESNPFLFQNTFERGDSGAYLIIENFKNLITNRNELRAIDIVNIIKEELIKKVENEKYHHKDQLYKLMVKSLFGKGSLDNEYDDYHKSSQNFYETLKQILLIRNLKIQNSKLYLKRPDGSPLSFYSKNGSASKFNAFQLSLMINSGVDEMMIHEFIQRSHIDWKELDRLNSTQSVDSATTEYCKALSLNVTINSVLTEYSQNTSDQDILCLANTNFSKLLEFYKRFNGKKTLFIKGVNGKILCEKDYEQKFSLFEGDFNAFQVYIMQDNGVDKDTIKKFIEDNYINWDASSGLGNGAIKMSELCNEFYNFGKPYSVIRKALCKGLDNKDIEYISKLQFKDLVKIYDYVTSKSTNSVKNEYIKNRDLKLIFINPDFNAFQLYMMIKDKLEIEIQLDGNPLAVDFVQGQIINFIVNNKINWDAEFLDGKSLLKIYPDIYQYSKSYPIIKKSLIEGITEKETNILAQCSLKNLIASYEDVLKLSTKKDNLDSEYILEDLMTVSDISEAQIPYFRNSGNNDDYPMCGYCNANNFNAFQVYLMNISNTDKNLIRKFIEKNDINWDAKLPNGKKISEEYPDFYKGDEVYFVMKSFYSEGFENKKDPNIACLSKMKFEDLYAVYEKIFDHEKQSYPYAFVKTASDNQVNENDPRANKIPASGNPSDQKEGDFNALQLYAMVKSNVDQNTIKSFIKKNYINWNAGSQPLPQILQLFPELYKYNNKIVVERILNSKLKERDDILSISNIDLKDLMDAYSDLKFNCELKEPFYMVENVDGIDDELSELKFTELKLSEVHLKKFDTFQLCMMIDCFERTLNTADLFKDKKAKQQCIDTYLVKLKNLADKIHNFIDGAEIGWEETLSDGKTVAQKYSYVEKKYSYADFAKKFPDEKNMVEKHNYLFKNRSNNFVTTNLEYYVNVPKPSPEIGARKQEPSPEILAREQKIAARQQVYALSLSNALNDSIDRIKYYRLSKP